MTHDLKKRVVKISDTISDLMNILVLIIMLVLIIGAIGVLARDTILFYKDEFSSGLGILLGSLLVLWVLMELLHTQIDFLKGGKFNVSIFVLVALVAFIRKLMVASLNPEKLEIAYYPVVVIGVLSLAYWLIKKADGSDIKEAGHS